MKISVNHNGETIIIEENDPNATLFDLIIRINEMCSIKQLPPIVGYEYNNKSLSQYDLDSTLFDLFGRDGDKTLTAFASVKWYLSLSPMILEEHRKSLLEAKQNLVQSSISEMPMAKESKNNNVEQRSDQYLVLNALPIPKYFGGDYSIHDKLGSILPYESLLIQFFSQVFTLNHDIDGRITVSINSTHAEQFRRRHDPSASDSVMDMQNYFSEYEEAQKNCKKPYTYPLAPNSDRTHSARISDYELIIRINSKNNVSGIYIRAYIQDEFQDNFTYVDLSNSYIPKAELAKVNVSSVLHNLSIHVGDVLFGVEPRKFRDFIIQHPAYHLARDYFLYFYQKAAYYNSWNKSNTLDEIIIYALKSKNTLPFLGATTKTILTMLNKDIQWFNIQSYESLKEALLQDAQLRYQASRRSLPQLLKPLVSKPNATNQEMLQDIESSEFKTSHESQPLASQQNDSTIRKLSFPSKKRPNDQLHEALNGLDLADAKSVDAALAAIDSALIQDADINSTQISDLGSLITGVPSQVTILQRAALLIKKIDKNQQEQTESLLRIMRHLISKNADVTSQPLLTLLLPSVDPAGIYTTSDASPHTAVIQLLFEFGAYHIDKHTAQAVSECFHNTPLKGLLSKILFVQEVREKIIAPLSKEHLRLCFSSSKHAMRINTVFTAINALNASLTKLQQGEVKELSVCRENIQTLIRTNLVNQSNLLNKYSDLEQIGRGLMNILLTIGTGVLPGVGLWLVTGHSFLSLRGKTKDAAQVVCNNAEILFGTKFTL